MTYNFLHIEKRVMHTDKQKEIETLVVPGLRLSLGQIACPILTSGFMVSGIVNKCSSSGSCHDMWDKKIL
jgi:hypothetical protein